jgi:cytochrome bd-type quinol oxidase subunit 2
MIHIDWFLLLSCMSAALVLALHCTIQLANANGGRVGKAARNAAGILYWPVCASLAATGLAILGMRPALAESFSLRPELWVAPVIGAAGLMGIHFCLSARWNLGSVLCSAVFLGGLFCSGTFVYRHFSETKQDKLTINIHAETHSDSGRSGLSPGVAADDSHGRRI